MRKNKLYLVVSIGVSQFPFSHKYRDISVEIVELTNFSRLQQVKPVLLHIILMLANTGDNNREIPEI